MQSPTPHPHPRTQGQSLQYAVTRRNIDVHDVHTARWSTHFKVIKRHYFNSSLYIVQSGWEDTITASRYAFWNFERSGLWPLVTTRNWANIRTKTIPNTSTLLPLLWSARSNTKIADVLWALCTHLLNERTRPTLTDPLSWQTVR